MPSPTSPTRDITELMGRRSLATIPKDQKSLLEAEGSWAVDMKDGPHGLSTVPGHVLQTLKEAFGRLKDKNDQGGQEDEEGQENQENQENQDDKDGQDDPEDEEDRDDKDDKENPKQTEDAKRPPAVNNGDEQNGTSPGSTPPSSPIDEAYESPLPAPLTQPPPPQADDAAAPGPSSGISEPDDLEIEVPQAQESHEAPINRVATLIHTATPQEPTNNLTNTASTTDTPPWYLKYALGKGPDHLPAIEWFNNLRGPILFNRMCVNKDNLDTVLGAYPEEVARVKAAMNQSKQTEPTAELEMELERDVEVVDLLDDDSIMDDGAIEPHHGRHRHRLLLDPPFRELRPRIRRATTLITSRILLNQHLFQSRSHSRKQRRSQDHDHDQKHNKLNRKPNHNLNFSLNLSHNHNRNHNLNHNHDSNQSNFISSVDNSATTTPKVLQPQNLSAPDGRVPRKPRVKRPHHSQFERQVGLFEATQEDSRGAGAAEGAFSEEGFRFVDELHWQWY
ncbi:hypothetical protein TASIC1_0015020400 [Trichoderma asperellum]|uniref:Uncharacterized protein n=1 Tax=Trichoderma asperellum TaxID=101201 RepID=A0A6V8R7D9_TRIAP|nr:hypothetical protein TASIC1_0015020400 [Trichoderma asperellum]